MKMKRFAAALLALILCAAFMTACSPKPEQPAAPVEEAANNAHGEVKLFATRTCPNCKQAEKLLTEAGIPFTRLLAEENGEEAARLGIRQAPTLVVGSEEDKYVGLGAVRKFIAEYND